MRGRILFLPARRELPLLVEHGPVLENHVSEQDRANDEERKRRPSPGIFLPGCWDPVQHVHLDARPAERVREAEMIPPTTMPPISHTIGELTSRAPARKLAAACMVSGRVRCATRVAT